MKRKTIIITLIIILILIILGILFSIKIDKNIKKITTYNITTKEEIESTSEKISKEDNKFKEEEKNYEKKETKKEEKSKETVIEEKKQESKQTTTTQTKQTENVKTQSMINNELRNTIQNKYGIKIKYGNEIGSYKPLGYTPTLLVDENTIYKTLNDMNTYLSYYPNSFFREIKNYGMPLTIQLIDSVPTDMSGVTDREFYDNIRITLCVNGSTFFFRVIHHEIFHYIEAFMESKSYPTDIFSGWDSLNPSDFKYGNIDSRYYFDYSSKPVYFMNSYGQTSAREDRATIFEDLMARQSETPNSFISSNIIWQKGKKMCEVIDKYFNSVTPNTTERWERFIYN